MPRNLAPARKQIVRSLPQIRETGAYEESANAQNPVLGLLEQQGVHRSAGSPKVDETDPTGKYGLAEKFREKLHIGHH